MEANQAFDASVVIHSPKQERQWRTFSRVASVLSSTSGVSKLQPFTKLAPVAFLAEGNPNLNPTQRLGRQENEKKPEIFLDTRRSSMNSLRTLWMHTTSRQILISIVELSEASCNPSLAYAQNVSLWVEYGLLPSTGWFRTLSSEGVQISVRIPVALQVFFRLNGF